MVLIGGKDTTSGPAIGAIVLLLAEEVLQRWTEHWLIGVGVIIVVVVIAAPNGIVPYLAQLCGRGAPNMPKPALQATELSKRFGGLVAVDRVNLELNPVEIHAVIGPNGAGKTTLLSMLAGELSPTAGRIRLEPQDITHSGSAERARSGIGRTFQRSAVIPGFSALDMVRLAALNRAGMQLLQPLASNKTATMLARRALARVGLTDRADSVTDVLSHGEKRRVEIAAVLALDPKILLLDEPLAGLGPDESRQVVALIEDLRRDCAILLIEHDIDIVFAVADRITVLDNGRVIACGTPSDIRASAAAREAYLGLEPA